MTVMEKDRKAALLDWYRTIKEDNFEAAEKMKQTMDAGESEVTDPEMKTLYKLMVARYHLLYKDLEKFASVIAEVDPDVENEQHWLNYYYYFFRGIYHFERNEYRTALELYNNARALVFEQGIEEIAQFYYKLSTVYHRLHRITLSNQYAEKALKIFKDKQNYNMMADCHNVLGLNNLFAMQYHDSERHFQDALICVEKKPGNTFKNYILHNTGFLYFDQKYFETALKYLNMVDNTHQIHDKYFYVQNLFLRTECYFCTDQITKAESLLNTVLDECVRNDNTLYFHRCEMLKSKFMQPAKFVDSYKEGIDYFLSNEIWSIVIPYCEELANYLGGIERFKEACFYYRKAIEARLQIEKERVLGND
ncbi:MAG TPA: hypothetical protein VFK44_14650 [Bacillales bacterium]|nr:hypothetical protein [Bacillales bacterium]